MIAVKGQSAAELLVEEQGLPSTNILKFTPKHICIYKELTISNEYKIPPVHPLFPSPLQHYITLGGLLPYVLCD